MIFDGQNFGITFQIGQCMVYGSITLIIVGLIHLVYILFGIYLRLSTIINDDDNKNNYNDDVESDSQKLYTIIQEILFLTFMAVTLLMVNAGLTVLIYYIQPKLAFISTFNWLVFTIEIILIVSCLYNLLDIY